MTLLTLYLAESRYLQNMGEYVTDWIAVVLVTRVYNLYSYSRLFQRLILLFTVAGGLVALALMISKLNVSLAEHCAQESIPANWPSQLITTLKGLPESIRGYTCGCVPLIPTEFWSEGVDSVFVKKSNVHSLGVFVPIFVKVLFNQGFTQAQL
jgi:hypothetical protein